MSKHLKLYNTLVGYNSDSREIPNVSFIKEDSKIKLEKRTEPYEFDEYYSNYFTLEAIENCTFTISYPSNYAYTTSQLGKYISYSTDNGSTWTTVTYPPNNVISSITFTAQAGNKILLKGKHFRICIPNYELGQSTQNPHITITSTGNFNVSGNILSLFYDNDFINHSTFPIYNWTYSSSSSQCTAAGYDLYYFFANNTKLISAEHLILPTNINLYCYGYMFKGCTSLVKGPKLPSTTLAEGCYFGMFQGCTSLTETPSLPATKLAKSCYAGYDNYGNSLGMFGNCTSLTKAPELPATELADYCYPGMFSGCTSLTEAPELPATELTNSCYSYMFSGCTSLTEAPELPATTLASNCYNGMFTSCTSLISAPTILPATTLMWSCYSSMFSGCSLLETAPILPAISAGVGYCYYNMFNNCSKLNYIKMLATNISGPSTTTNWVQGVASTGTFVKNSAATWTTTGVNGIPTGWTVQTASS